MPLGCSEGNECNPSLTSLGISPVECGLAEVRVVLTHVLSLLTHRKESSDGLQPVPVRGQRRTNCENLVQGPGSGTEARTDVKHSR